MDRKLNIALLLVLLLGIGRAIAQQDALYTHYAFNRLALNPGYAGSRDNLSLGMHFRNQWQGIDGAPQTLTAFGHAPWKKSRVSLGGMIIDDRRGLISETGMWAYYAYRVPFGRGKLSFGLNAGVTHFQANLADNNLLEQDDLLLLENQSSWLPNFGAGIYYHTDRFFAGFSVPSLIQNALTQQSVGAASVFARTYRHYYTTSGFVIPFSEKFKWRLTSLCKVVANSPVEFDFTSSFLIMDALWLGAAYRTNASVDFSMEVLASPFLRFGYAYDLVLRPLGDYSSGSHEFFVGFDLRFNRNKSHTPRNISPSYF